MSTLTPPQKEILKAAIQDGLPLTPQPYFTLALKLGLTEKQVTDQLQAWVTDGYIKRLGLVVRHHAVGYNANAMVVWDIPEPRIDNIGNLLRSSDIVSLCYRRRRQLPDWPYNLYCMIHGKDRNQVQAQIQWLIEKFDLSQYDNSILFSTQQFKQTGGSYAKLAC